MGVPVVGSQICTVSSLLPVARRSWLSGVVPNATEFTQLVWPVRVRWWVPSEGSQIRTV